jgi:choline dehydrogenase-like flavoprotein
MFIDAREVTNGHRLDATVCIIGGGIAGIAIALNLAEQDIDVCLLESGGFHGDPHTDDLYRGENIGIPYDFDCNYRSRFLGGSSNCWGGWNRPLEPLDFTQRHWVPNSGWPIDKAALDSYYDRTHELLQLGPHSFDSEFWGAALKDPRVRRTVFSSGRVEDSFTQFSPPARLGKLYRDQLENHPRIRVLLYANTVNIATESSAQTATHVDVSTLNGRRLTVHAKHFVLAAGGIENARLLLASNQTQREGLGNAHDLVGRYFMDHPRFQIGNVRLRKPYAGNKLYDIKHQDKSRVVYAHNTSVAAQWVLTPKTLEAEQLLHARVWLRSVFVGEDTAAVAALHRFTQTYLHDGHANLQPRRDLQLMLRDPLSVLGYTCARALPVRPLTRGIRFEIVGEPDPNPASRVTLSNERDALGMPRARVDWKLGPLVQKTFKRTLEIVAEELHREGIADCELPPLFPDGQWPTTLEGTWHHMGTTKMHDSPQLGVVDRDCRVHGMHNLFIAGSSVFPTGGGNFPTMTLAALALRLGDHLGALINNANVANTVVEMNSRRIAR